MQTRHPSVRVAVLVAGVAALIGAAVALGAVWLVGPPRQTTVIERYRANAPSIGTRPVDTQWVLATVEPSVVCISVEKRVAGESSTMTDHATGMIVTRGGRILTNHHVVRDAITITVTLHGANQAVRAHVVADDADRDIALIQVDAEVDLPPVTFGNSDAVQVGDAVVTVGNALGLDGHPTVTAGIVSAVDREVSRPTGSWPPKTLTGLLQTDAAINGGASGGPLVSSSGAVIGMNTLVATGDEASPAEDIGFAIPANALKARLAAWAR